MKLSDFGKKPKKPEKENKPTGSWTRTRDQFVKLKPLDLHSMPGSFLICDVSHRPYVSKVANLEGYDYASFGIGNGKMAVLRYKKKKKETQ